MNFLGSNIRFLRERSGLNQDEMQAQTGITGKTLSNYERGNTEPNIKTIIAFSKFFSVDITTLLTIDLRANVHLIEKSAIEKKQENVHLNVHPNVHPTGKKQPNSTNLTINVAEPEATYSKSITVIPITDISVAAGTGVYNSEYIDNVDAVRLPAAFVKTGHTYLCVRIKGLSMSPTLQDGGYVIIRHMDHSEWVKMPDERIFVVVDGDGKAYLKRVKNRFKQGFIVLKSDNPDQATYPNFNLNINEITSIWYVEWYFSAKMPNIHDQYYSRLQKLEDKFDLLLAGQLKINP